jgi:hypothetical protein
MRQRRSFLKKKMGVRRKRCHLARVARQKCGDRVKGSSLKPRAHTSLQDTAAAGRYSEILKLGGERRRVFDITLVARACHLVRATS